MRGIGTGAVLILLAAPVRAEIAWQDWSDDVFARARRESRFVLLDLGAVWCHWCHVMEETTYKDPRVVSLLGARFLPVRVDQDSRPDLSNRYEDYGWPATVIFDARGRELVKLAGYIPPPRMASLLEAVTLDPTPGPSVRDEGPLVPAAPHLDNSLRNELDQLLVDRYDEAQGGWGFVKKFLDWDSVEYSLRRARQGDKPAETRARQTLDAQFRLIDPVWGGVYQYSHGGHWENPHFEKLVQFQAENLRIYALAYAQAHDERYLRAGRDVLRFLRTFLRSPEGAFYVSQDADVVPGEHAGEYFALSDAERRKLGIPRIDSHLYTRETAWVVTALVAWHEATGEPRALDEALQGALWIVTNRSLPGGGFRHDGSDPAGPYLGDSVAAARAFLALHAATGDRQWLGRAEEALGFIARCFRREAVPGFVTAVSAGSAARPQRDENVALARVALGLARASGRPQYRAVAEDAMRYLAIPEVARRFSTASVLLVDEELGQASLQ